MSVEKLRRETSLDLRIRSATADELGVLIAFFDGPMIREHYKHVIAAARAELHKRMKQRTITTEETDS